MSQLKKLLVALTPMGAAAFVAGGGTFASVGELVRWAEHPTRHAVSPAESTKGDPLWRTKKALLLMMAIGAAAYFGFSGTFANFQAETANNGSSISSGTLTLNNQVNTNAACFSYNSATADNGNANCDSAFAITNVAPGTFTSAQVAKITVTNSGSIDASKLYLYASQVNGKLLTPIVAGPTTTSSIVLTTSNPAGLEGSIANGDSVVVSYGGHSQTFIANGPTVGGATSIAVNPTASAFAFPAGASVTNTQGNTTAANTDCYDTKTTVPISGSTTGSQLNFNSTTGNPFCGAVLMYIQEISGANSYCWFGKGSTWNVGGEDVNGRCYAPISATTTITSGSISSIPLSPGTTLNGNVRTGDSIVVTQGTHTQTFTAGAAATFGATSITLNTSTAIATPFTSGATVTNSTSQGALDSNAATDNVTAFQTAHHLAGGKLELFPVSAPGTIDNTSGASELTKSGGSNPARTFYVGLYLPVPGGSNQNALQGLASTFGLTWHIDQ